MTSYEEAGKKLHDLIKQGEVVGCKSPYLGRQPLVCKQNQAIAIAELKAKRERSEHGIPLPNFALPLLLLHFHGMREHLLENGVPVEAVRPLEFPP